MGLERGAIVEKLDGAWSARFSFRLGAWSGDQGTIDRSMEQRCKNRVKPGALETPERVPLELKQKSSGARSAIEYFTGAWSA